MIEESKILEVLNEWKKFWKMEYLPRNCSEKITDKKRKDVTDIIGVRRSGKSSILALAIKKMGIDEKQILYVNFEDPSFVNYYSIELIDKIWDTYKIRINSDAKPFIFFDEIQLITGWEKWVRKARDLELGQIFVTGSSSKLLSKEFGTALTGRHISFVVFPLSFTEFIRFKRQEVPETLDSSSARISMQKMLNKYILEGGFPEVILSGNTELLKNYFEDILYKDIMLRHEIRDANSLRKIATFLMTNLSSQITYNSLKNTFGLSLDLIRNYLSYMEEAFLVFQIPIFAYSLKEQEIAPKKIYCIDNGLRNAVSFKFSKDEGKLAENLVFLKLKQEGKEIYYWKGKKEVDFVLKNKDQTLTAIDVSYTDKIEEIDASALLEFKKNFKQVKDLIFITKNTEKKENNIHFIPLWKWLLS